MTPPESEDPQVETACIWCGQHRAVNLPVNSTSGLVVDQFSTESEASAGSFKHLNSEWERHTEERKRKGDRERGRRVIRIQWLMF